MAGVLPWTTSGTKGECNCQDPRSPSCRLFRRRVGKVWQFLKPDLSLGPKEELLISKEGVGWRVPPTNTQRFPNGIHEFISFFFFLICNFSNALDPGTQKIIITILQKLSWSSLKHTATWFVYLISQGDRLEKRSLRNIATCPEAAWTSKVRGKLRVI